MIRRNISKSNNRVGPRGICITSTWPVGIFPSLADLTCKEAFTQLSLDYSEYVHVRCLHWFERQAHKIPLTIGNIPNSESRFGSHFTRITFLLLVAINPCQTWIYCTWIYCAWIYQPHVFESHSHTSRNFSTSNSRICSRSTHKSFHRLIGLFPCPTVALFYKTLSYLSLDMSEWFLVQHPHCYERYLIFSRPLGILLPPTVDFVHKSLE